MYSLNVFWLLGTSLLLFNIELTLAKDWAVILVGHDWYDFTYAFEAGAYKQYNDLVKNGIDPENIIVISPDSAAFDEYNAIPGLIAYGYEKGEFSADFPVNQYENVPIDYKCRHLKPEHFYQILAGEANGNLTERGSGKVVKSGPNDNVFLYVHTFAAYMFYPFGWHIPTVFYLNNREFLVPEEFVPVIEELAAAKHFKKMFIHWHSTDSASMFDNYLETDLGILAYSLGGRYCDFSMCHWNKYLSAYTSTCQGYEHFAYLDKAIAKNGAKETFLDLYSGSGLTSYDEEVVHNLYGDFDVALKPIKEFYGPKMKNSQAQTPIETMQLKKEARTCNRSQPISEMLINKIPKQVQKQMQKLVDNIISQSIRGTEIERDTVYDPVEQRLLLVQIDCFRSAVDSIFKTFTEKSELFVFRHGYQLLKLCSLDVPKEKIISAIEKAW